MNKRFRMISLMSEALALELEDVLERDEKYEKDFRNDFTEEIGFLMERELHRRASNRSPKEIENQISNRESSDQESKIVKDIYRALAKATHPDVAGEDKMDEFKEISNAYIAKDLVALMAAANKNDISPDVDEKALGELKEMLNEQRAKIEEIKQTVRWQWGISSKNEEARKRISRSLGIKEDEYRLWMNERSRVKEAQQAAERAREAQQKAERDAELRAQRRAKRSTNSKPHPIRANDLKREREKRANRKKS